MGCSAGKQQPLDRIPSTSSTTDLKVKENGKSMHMYSNDAKNSELPNKRNLERRDTGKFSNGLGHGDEKNEHQATSLIDLSSMKKHKDMPLSGPICNNNKEVSKSQSDFFKMLDARIEQGKDFETQEVT